ncbi:uncharacterized protein KGF55_001234 [Candida pseudojiufengensis]|uniref:uncharacterized protein n=1 Tax=Candida pseudojiufengensis TaxID=497109 RepID=UPI002223EFD7|nr:uncharacterized protein KGF55_001234 [Candida pseudojiufengensis]KAI5965870.1 hypothetical protein KGF55_001234 [Candida pseudojiufengensis]
MSHELDIFLPARDSLRISQDERETVIRSCREITSYSKKCIFSLHRHVEKEAVYNEIKDYLKIIKDHLIQIDKIYKNENYSLRGSISGAIEELIEFFTFGFYKYHRKLLRYELFIYLIDNLIEGSLDYVAGIIIGKENLEEFDEIDTSNPHFYVDVIDKADYIMGLFDCSGEIMRMVISESTNTDGMIKNTQTLIDYDFMKKLYEHYITLQTYYPGVSIYNGIFDNSINSKGNNSFKKKLQVFQSSINKIENTLIDNLISDKETL